MSYCQLLHLSVSTRGVIGQFCGPYFTVQHTKLQLVSFPVLPIKLIANESPSRGREGDEAAAL